MSERRIWLHTDEQGTRRILDPDDVYWIEADAGDTYVRLRDRRRLRDLRPFSEVIAAFPPHHFARVHRNHAVNLLHVLEVRRRTDRDLELKLAPPRQPHPPRRPPVRRRPRSLLRLSRGGTRARPPRPAPLLRERQQLQRDQQVPRLQHAARDSRFAIAE